MAYQTAEAKRTAFVFLNGVSKGSPRKTEAKNPPANTTIIVDSQHAIGCLREKGIEPKNKWKIEIRKT